MSYDPQSTERDIYTICNNRGYFEIDGNASIANDESKTFCLMMPPPNVTGVLHIGHALTFTLQDIITRFKRMDGFITLYQPGLDHAGIATQNVVEKQILALGSSKDELGREAFLQKVWEWKEESGGKIVEQMQALGISPAWSRLRFTMDAGLQNAVREAFVQWYEKGLIYQGDYMVNWCVKDGALSDIEVQHIEQDTHLYYLRYPMLDSSETLLVATTRPETFFGDSAVMINPNDTRYAHVLGKSIKLPLVGREIPIIADNAVDMEFGTGVVKVTPAHDENDYAVGIAHALESITIFDEKGVLNAHALGFAGRDRLEARADIVDALQEAGAVEKIEPYRNQVGVCYRCGNVIEPYISKQWFIDKKIATSTIEKVNHQAKTPKDTANHLCQTSAHNAPLLNPHTAVARFYPPQWLNNFNAWMEDLRPWCISRQLWWGHRIPVWYCQSVACGYVFASKNARESTCPKCGCGVVQDPDVLDTWFSSGLWAFSTLGWGNNGACKECYGDSDLSRFYPNSLLITGFDILFFWVARMLFSGESLLGGLPFRDVYLHALVRDEHGQKMSKSKGNVIDPLAMIAEYGADSLRFSLAYACVQGRDVRLAESQLELAKNFANKLYNATQFLLLYAKQADSGFSGFCELEGLSAYSTPLGRYAKSRLNCAIKELRAALESYRFNDGASVVYRFLWGEFCDWCIELAKAQKESIHELGAVMIESMKLLHPYMPFLTESLYHSLRGSALESSASIMIARYPSEIDRDRDVEREFDSIKDAIVSLRRAKALIDLANKPIESAYIATDSSFSSSAINAICKLAKVSAIECVDRDTAIKRGLDRHCVADIGEVVKSYLPLQGIDLGPIISRLNNQNLKLSKEIAKLESLAHNAKFLAHAPKDVLESNARALEVARAKRAEVLAQLQVFEQK